MAGRLTRFMNLERPHGESHTPPASIATRKRFEGGASEFGVEFDFGEQPFLRCPACEADNGRHAEKCINCQRPLQTPEVRAWNAEFWEKRKAEKPPEMPPLPRSVPLSDENRKLAEAVAREIGDRERARLSWWSDLGPYDSTPLGFRLLSGIADGRTRFTAAAGLLAVLVLAGIIALTAREHPGLQVGCAVVVFLLLALFTPNTRRRGGWWRSYWD